MSSFVCLHLCAFRLIKKSQLVFLRDKSAVPEIRTRSCISSYTVADMMEVFGLSFRSDQISGDV